MTYTTFSRIAFVALLGLILLTYSLGHSVLKHLSFFWLFFNIALFYGTHVKRKHAYTEELEREYLAGLGRIATISATVLVLTLFSHPQDWLGVCWGAICSINGYLASLFIGGHILSIRIAGKLLRLRLLRKRRKAFLREHGKSFMCQVKIRECSEHGIIPVPEASAVIDARNIFPKLGCQARQETYLELLTLISRYLNDCDRLCTVEGAVTPRRGRPTVIGASLLSLERQIFVNRWGPKLSSWFTEQK